MSDITVANIQLSNIRHKDFRLPFVLRPSCSRYAPPLDSETVWTGEFWLKTNLLNPNGPKLLESIATGGGGQMAPPPSELTNYNHNAKTDVTLYSQFLKLTI